MLLRPSSVLVAVVCSLVVSSAFASSASEASTGEAHRWIGQGGEPLPFRTDADVEDFLRTARLGESKVISSGLNRPTRYDLELDGVRARAIFRTVEVASVSRSPSRNPLTAMRDSWVHELAAWKLSRLLGLDHVPPAVERKIGGQLGSLQLWVEGARPESLRIEAGEAPRFPARWHRHRQVMAVFDNLIYNFDRNPGNILVDETGKVWFVDHTRSFALRPALVDVHAISQCPIDLWRALKTLNETAVGEAVESWLDPAASQAILVRRDLLVEHLERRIEERGRGAVLLD